MLSLVISIVIIAWIFLFGYRFYSIIDINNSKTTNNFYVCFLIGAIISFELLLIQIPLDIFKYIVYVLTFLLVIWYLFENKSNLTISKTYTLLFFLFVFIFMPLFINILYTPLQAWDARSIWFFHSKMIYFNNGFSPDIIFGYPPYSWSHYDYPNFIPAFGALASEMAGFWNEYLPKIGLIIPAFSLLLGIYCLDTNWLIKAASLFIVLFVFPNFSEELLINGYMDAWLAVFVFLGHLNLMVYFNTRSKSSLDSALISFLILPLLKNEGLVLLIYSFITTFLLLIYLRNLRIIFQKSSLLIILIGLIPTISWNIYKILWGLKNDIFQQGYIDRVYERLMDGTVYFIVKKIVTTNLLGIIIIISLLTFIALLIYTKNKTFTIYKLRSSLLYIIPLITAFLYIFTIFIIYLVTPHNIEWHINTSLSRVSLSPLLLVFLSFISFLFLFQDRIKNFIKISFE